MTNMLIATVEIVGVRPFLWHAFTPEAIPIGKKEKTGVAGNDPLEWQRSVLVADHGQLYVRHTYIFGCLRDGAKFSPYKRGSLQPLLSSTLLVLDRVIPIHNRSLPDSLTTDDTAPIYLDVQSVRNPTTRARNVRYRVAASPGWAARFQITWDKTVIAREQMRSIIIDAGRLVGVGDGRAIGYGRFELNAFEAIDSDPAA